MEFEFVVVAAFVGDEAAGDVDVWVAAGVVVTGVGAGAAAAGAEGAGAVFFVSCVFKVVSLVTLGAVAVEDALFVVFEVVVVLGAAEEVVVGAVATGEGEGAFPSEGKAVSSAKEKL